MDSRWFRAQGIDAKSIHGYVARCWLQRLTRGVYRRPLPEGIQAQDSVSWESAVLFLQRIMKYDVHLGGVSALELAGLSHYLHLGGKPPIRLYGDIPTWLKRLPMDAQIVLHRRTLFGEDQAGIIDADRGPRASSQVLNIWRWPLKASTSERAIFEALDELTDQVGFARLDKIFEGLTILRPMLLKALLTVCRSVKVRRRFYVFADRHQHAWLKCLDVDKVDFGSGPRAFVEGGKLHPSYHIYVPQEFVPNGEIELNQNA